MYISMYYGWVVTAILGVFLLVFHKVFFRLILGMFIVPENKIGLVTKKFVLFGADKQLPAGRIIATKGEAGFQAKPLAPGLYFKLWSWQYEVKLEDFTEIPQGKIGLVMAKDGAPIPTGNILARKVDCDNFQDTDKFLANGGQKGRQTAYLTSGIYRINKNLFEIEKIDMIHIEEDMVGIIVTKDGEPLQEGQIAGKPVAGHRNFQNVDVFLDAGGNKGLQPQVILAGSYNINSWFVDIEKVPMTKIEIGNVGVVICYIGEEGKDLSGPEFKHGNIVANGEKGVWLKPYEPGKYPINTRTMKIEPVPTTNLVLNWATGRTESHKLDEKLSTITVRSKDGFTFNLDVSQIIHIPMNEAPKVIARFGNMINLVSQVLEPTIGNYFRNSAQNSDVIEFLVHRKERQEEAKVHINKVLAEYNVNGVDTLIGDITPPESLMNTLTDRKIAEEQKTTYTTQMEAQKSREDFEKQQAIANMQAAVVQANQGVEIAEKIAGAAVKKAEGDATSMKLNAAAKAESLKLEANAQVEVAEKTSIATVRKAEGDATSMKLNAAAKAESIKLEANAQAEATHVMGQAEASKTLAIGEANAKAYEQSVKAMGASNFANLKITEIIGKEKVEVMPKVLIMGNEGSGSGPINALLGFNLLEKMSPKDKTE